MPAAQRPPRGGAVLRRDREARIVFGPIAREDGVGLDGRGRPGQAEFGDEPILQGAPQPFDAPLRLRRERVDASMPKGRERVADLRRVLRAAQLLGQRPVIVVALQRAVLVHVDAPRHAVRGHDGAQHAQIARRRTPARRSARRAAAPRSHRRSPPPSRATGPRPSSQSWRLPSQSSISPACALRSRRRRCCRGRGAAAPPRHPAARSTRRTVRTDEPAAASPSPASP